MARIKVIYIISFIDTALEFEWVISKLDRSKFDLSIVLLNSKHSKLADFASKSGILCQEFHYESKKNLPAVILKLYKHFKINKPDIIHAHLFDASLAALTAAKMAGIKNRVYTRHHSSFHHIYFKSHVKIDKFINSLATNIIAISPLVEDILVNWENCSKNKIIVIPHGLDFGLFKDDLITNSKDKYGLNNNYPIIGVISRYTHWKGIQYIIPAFKLLLKKYPNSKLLLANANGSYRNEIVKLLNELPPDSYQQIEFDSDIISLYKSFDVFVHTPIDEHSEAFGQIYIESLALGIPSVFTLSGIAPNFVEHNVNAIVVQYKNSQEILDAINVIIDNTQLKNTLINNGKNAVASFSISNKIDNLERFYCQITNVKF